MKKSPIITDYVSKIDTFLEDFDKAHPELSKSQLKERNKYKRIAMLRDNVTEATPETKVWNKF